jgi:hypothetical protein
MKNSNTILAIVFLLFPPPMAWSADPIYVAVSAPDRELRGIRPELAESHELAVGWPNTPAESTDALELVYNDSKSDPKDSAALAQKYTSDPKYVAQIGDFTSTACMAAQPIYDKAGMVQLSPTASHPKFAPGSIWSFGIIGTQAGEGPFMARYAVQNLGKKKIAVLYINNDLGIATKDYFQKSPRKWADIWPSNPSSKRTRISPACSQSSAGTSRNCSTSLPCTTRWPSSPSSARN